MFEFLKSKTKMRPEELGITLATVLAATWFQKIIDYVMEFQKKKPGITESELSNLWQTILLLYCAVISTAIESSSIQDNNRKIVLDAFWNTVSDLLKEHISEQDSAAFEANTPTLYPKLRELIVDTPTTALGPGRALFEIAMPQRDVRSHMDTIDDLTSYFFSTRIALTQFTVESIKKTKLEKSLIAYE